MADGAPTPADYEKLGAFYLGKIFDTATGKTTDELLLYDSQDLVTHAVCVGMTGSGKTGLCIGLLEEAAIDGIPSIVIDPKGDLANLLLTFPGLSGAEFAPWVNADDAQRAGTSVEEFAAAEAAKWRDGLAGWGEDGGRIQRLRDAADFAIYTPGSDAGIPVSVLAGFSPPAGNDAEAAADAVSGITTGLLSLIGIDADPLQSREHILVSTLIHHAWASGQTIDIPTLIGWVQTPPITRIGVLDVEQFYPGKDRFSLAMQLNGVLAAPGFELWLRGEPLDVARFLHTADGKPRVSVFSISHLSDQERMFFVTLLLNGVVGWMRSQSGTTSLRAIVYMDEIFGYFPPVSEPPSKRPLLTLLKQARAFGIGIVLATQNPVDLDYKGLSNTGTWLIGRLQAQRDKDRLLDGLESAAGTGLDRGELDARLSGLPKRTFLLHNVHEKEPVTFQTRWTLSYLRGPIVRDGIRTLMADRRPAALPPAAATTAASPRAPAPAPSPAPPPSTFPSLEPGVPRHYVPPRGTAPAGATLAYVPAILGEATVRFTDRKAGVDFADVVTRMTAVTDAAIPVDWSSSVPILFTTDDLEESPRASAVFADVPRAATMTKSYSVFTRDFAAWLYASQTLTVPTCEVLGLTGAPGESEGEFRVRIAQAAREGRDERKRALEMKYGPKLTTLQERARKADAAVEREREQVRNARVSTALSVGTSILGGLFGRRRSTTAAAGTVVRGMSRSMGQSGDVDRAEETVAALQSQLIALDQEFQAELAQVDSQLDAATMALGTAAVKPRKSDIDVRLVALAFVPHWKDAQGILTAAS